jgi:hypothetical protein
MRPAGRAGLRQNEHVRATNSEELSMRFDSDLKTDARAGGRAAPTRACAATLVVVCALAVAVLGAFAPAQALAAPELEVGVEAPPQAFTGGTAEYELTVDNVGDDPTSGPITVEATLPAELTATAASDGVGGAIWDCSVAPDGRTVSCEWTGALGPIPPGSEACEPTPLAPCPITIDAEIASDAADGKVTAEFEACGGGAPACAAAGHTMLVLQPRPFGARFGLVPINEHPEAIDAVPALPDADEAFWAGACERASMPAPGVELPGDGIGEAPDEVFAPNSANPFQVAVLAPAVAAHCIDWGTPFPLGSGLLSWVTAPDGRPPSWRSPAETQAGAHPDGTTTMALRRDAEGQVEGHLDNVVVELPAGFVGNPQAVAECSAEEFAVKPPLCPPESQVGVLNLHLRASSVGANLGAAWDAIYPVWNLEPRQGRAAELGFAYASGEKATTVRLTARVRTESDYGVTAFAGQVPASLPLSSQAITLWGVPWAAENDEWRAQQDLRPSTPPCASQPETGGVSHYIPPGGLTEDCQARHREEWGEIRPFLSSETECNQAPVTELWMDSYQFPAAFASDGVPAPHANWVRASAASPPVDGCEELDFEPDMGVEATSAAADAPSGLVARLELGQNDDPPAGVAHDPGDADDPAAGAPGHWRSQEGLATAHLKDTVVRLPAGMSVNPSGAAGLQGCSDGQIGVRGADPATGRPLFNNGDPFDGTAADGAECPQASIIGTARVQTPLLDEDLDGELVLGTPGSTDPTSGQMFRMFLVVRNRDRGLVAKVYGSATADPQTGRLTATFANNPEVPFDRLTVQVKGGQRGMLATPQRCASHSWTSTLTPWSSVGAPAGTVADSQLAGTIPTDAACAFGFAPTMRAGVSDPLARASRPFELRLTRPQGQQTVRGLRVAMPQGLLASVRGVPLCTNAQAAANACPVGSRIGVVDGAAGSGDPFVLERKGSVFFTEGYKGAPYGLAISVPVEAGPFRGARALSPILVRAALHVDRRTAEVTAASDPLPQIHHGIPLRLREIVARIDRPGFMLNPSSCAPKEIRAHVSSPAGAAAAPASFFQADRCERLGFKPRLGLRLTGRRQTVTGRHPGVRALVRQRGIGEAAIDRARVVLPKSLALDPANAQALCEFEDGTRPDVEDHCPDGSLLNRPLTGDVYFVKNIRIDPDTGNEIRTLPMIVVALRGEIAVNLRGESSTTEAGKLVNTFAQVPDAPINRFAMRIQGGRNGILAVTRTRRGRIDLCRGRHVAVSRMAAHNGRTDNSRVRMATPCPKRRASAGKICRKRTNGKRALRRCIANVKRTRAKRRRAASRRKAAAQRQSAGRRAASGGAGEGRSRATHGGRRR